MWLCNTKRTLMNFLFCFLIELALAEDESWLVFTPERWGWYSAKTRYKEPMFGIATSYFGEHVNTYRSGVWSSGITVRPLSKNGGLETHIPVDNFRTVLTYDFEEKKIYWSVFSLSAIHRTNVDGTSTEIFFNRTTLNGGGITGLAFDWITKNIYLALRNDYQIMACDIRRQRCAVLVHDSKYKPFRITLHPQSGTMVWTNEDTPAAIFKSSMDGSNPTQLTAEQPRYFFSIVIDHALSRLYWISRLEETVHTCDLDGKNVSTLKAIGNTSIEGVGLALTGRDIYWFDKKENQINKCNKIDGHMFEVVKSGVKLSEYGSDYFDMILMWSGGQPKDRVNHCANHSCDHICVLTETSYKCLCPDRLNLAQDGQHCEDSGPKMFISTSGGTYVLSIATLHVTKISNSSSLGALTHDYLNSKVYWAGGNNGSTIFSSGLNGSDVKSLVTVSGREPIKGLAYDWIAHNIYYTNGNHVGVCDSSGTSCAVLLNDYSNSPNGIALFPSSGLMFWYADGQSNSTTRARMDGSAAELFDIKTGLTKRLAIDNQESQLYRLHQNGTIITTDLEGTLLRTYFPIEVLGILPHPVKELKDIAVGGDNLYWINNKKIQKCNKYGCTYPETIKEFNWHENVFKMSLFHREGQLQDRVNHCAGGICSYICVLTEKYFRCTCPSGMYLMDDGRTCAANFSNITNDAVSTYKPIIFKPKHDNGGRFGFRGSWKYWICADGTFVDLTDLCNGTLGCPDGTDEGQYCDIRCEWINRTEDGKDCTRTPNALKILCPQGFQQAADTLSCEDANECLQNVCENRHCINTNGGYECHELPESIENQVQVTDPLGVALAAAIPTVLAIALIGIALFFGVKYIQTRKILRKLTPGEVLEFMDGNEEAANSTDGGADKAMLMPFRLVLQPDNITIARDAILGSGQFGVVYRGFYEDEAVAIKTFKRTVGIDEFKAVLAEAKIMAFIGDHLNVVRFVGADVSAIADRKLVLVTELSPYGDLLGYLRKIEPDKWLHQSNELNRDSVTPVHLGRWCEEIACGMQHLEFLKIVHGDLAARNVLVFKDNVVKITDFGLSKQLYGNTQYMMKRQRMLPWKWCALELLTRQEFSTDSDIWAFGVTAWEIFSLGRPPYRELAIGTGFIDYLEQGNRLPQPIYATTGVYEILKRCWDVERSSRPRFAILRDFFREESMRAGISNHAQNFLACRVDYGRTKV